MIVTTTEGVTPEQLQPLSTAAREVGGEAVVSVMHSTAPASKHKSQPQVLLGANVACRCVLAQLGP